MRKYTMLHCTAQSYGRHRDDRHCRQAHRCRACRVLASNQYVHHHPSHYRSLATCPNSMLPLNSNKLAAAGPLVVILTLQ